jgi:diguanylate cyclase (GGDEF)-like protein
VQYASDGPERPEDDRLTIYDLNGGPVAMLTWSMLSLGTELRQQLLPFVLLVGIGILGICGFAARYFHSQHSALEQAKKVAATDQLTGLLNRAGLAEKLGRKDVLRSLERGHLAAIYVDLNKFKDLNDTFGHRAGDMALRVTTERLQSVVRGSDFVARLGGDEFTCVVINSDPESAAMVIAQRILDLSAAPISLNGHDQIVMPSIGLAVAAPGTHWEAVLSQSDAAMFWSKRKKADYPIVFRKSMDVGNF